MRHVSLVLAALGLLGAAAAGAGANRWTTHGPPGGSVRSIASAPSDPRILYAETRFGAVWRSDDGGASWRQVLDELSDLYSDGRGALTVDPSDPDTAYLVTVSSELFPRGDVWRTTDGGVSWRRRWRGLQQAGGVAQVVFDAASPRVLYAATGAGVFRSLDGGRLWRPARAGLGAGTAIDALAADPLRPGILFASAGTEVFRSDDGGARWRPADEGLPRADHLSVNVFAVAPRSPDTVYAGLRGDPGEAGIWKTTDGGASWSDTAAELHGESIRDLVIDPGENDVLWALGEFWIWHSSDGGRSWTRREDHLELVFIADLEAAATRPATLYAAGLGSPENSRGAVGGVSRSTDGGATWRRVGLPTTFATSLALTPSPSSMLFAGTALNGLFRSPDAGTTWTHVAYYDEVTVAAVVADPLRPERLFAALDDNYYDKGIVSVSEDGGATWAAVADDLPSFQSLAVDPAASDSLLAVNRARYNEERSELYESHDAGVTWSLVEGLRGQVVSSVLIVAGAPRSFYAYGDSGIHSSRDGGATWSAGGGLPEGRVAALAADPDDRDRLYAATEAGLYLSTDGAASWRLLSAELSGVSQEALVIDVRDPRHLYAGTPGRGVWRSADGGASWEAFNPGLEHPVVLALALDPDVPGLVHAATAGGGAYSFLPDPCVEDDITLCLDDEAGDRRFRVRLAFHTAVDRVVEGEARATPLAPLGVAAGGIFAFFNRENPEALVKVLDGCAINGRFWVFAAAATTVGFELRVEDTRTGLLRTYVNPDGNPASTVTDSAAFATCDSPSASRRSAPIRRSVTAAQVPPEGDRRDGGVRAAVAKIAAEPCRDDATTLCIDGVPGDRRFRVRLRFETALGTGRSGDAEVTPLAPLGLDDGGILSFFDRNNPEVLVKVLDGCAVNGRFWVFAAAATTVGFELRVEDTVAGVARTYTNPDGRPAATITDVGAFGTCPGVEAGMAHRSLP